MRLEIISIPSVKHYDFSHVSLGGFKNHDSTVTACCKGLTGRVNQFKLLGLLLNKVKGKNEFVINLIKITLSNTSLFAKYFICVQIPLYGCGGTSQLVLVDIRQLSEGYVANIGEVLS